MEIKIYGLQRSGTNYIAHLVNTNFKDAKCLVNVGGWKHGHYAANEILGKEVNVLVIVKNPYAWLKSVYSFWGPNKQLNIGPNLSGMVFEQFVRSKLILEKQKGVPYLLRAPNPIQHWNNMNFHWTSISMEEKRVCILTYETLLYSMESAMLQISDAFDLEPVSSDLSFKNYENTFEPSGEEIRTKDELFKKKYYINKTYLRDYSPNLLDFVNSQLDSQLMKNFEYQYENSSSGLVEVSR